MSMKKAALALVCFAGLAAQAKAANVSGLISAVNQAQNDINTLKGLIASGQLGQGPAQPGPNPSNPPVQPPPPGCTFCDEGLVNEGDPNAALDFLAQAGGALTEARGHLSRYAQGIDINFSFGFGCSYTGDAAIDLATADLALGFPGNLNPQWRNKVDYTVNNLSTARNFAGCP